MNNDHQPKSRPPMVHELKIEPKHFAGQLDGTEAFELRLDDRDFKAGDTLCLREWAAGEYTGRSISRQIVSLLRGPGCGLQQGRTILSIAPVEPQPQPQPQADATVTVDAKALRDILYALTGPGHYIRELQATRSIAKLTGVKNPIDVLLDQFNAQAGG